MDDVQKALRKRYTQIHLLMFVRSMEKAETNGKLFDILESMPKEYPMAWNSEEAKWETTDLLQCKTRR